jgi:MarR family transcriptional regulator, organic hydroperoxide resistance regulator
MTSQNSILGAIENWANIYLLRSITEFFDYLKHHDISMHQAYVLTYIFFNGPCKISDLSGHMMVSAAATSQMVDRLEKQDLVKRTAEPGDRRVRNVVLSSKGEKLVKQSIAARQSWIKDIPDELSEEQQNQIIKTLNLLVSIYQEKTT